MCSFNTLLSRDTCCISATTVQMSMKFIVDGHGHQTRNSIVLLAFDLYVGVNMRLFFYSTQEVSKKSTMGNNFTDHIHVLWSLNVSL